MSVLDSKGALLAAPVLIADECIRLLPVFSGDLNGDGREDFVSFVPVKPRCGLACCDVGFALSTGGGYRVTALRSTVSPGARDFVDFEDGICRFVHAELTAERRDTATAADERLITFRLMEFRGGRVVMSDDPRFPRIVRLGSPRSGGIWSPPALVEPTSPQRLPPARLYRRRPPRAAEMAQECSL